MNVPIILATGREGRQSKKVADLVFERGNFTEIIDVRDWAKPVTNRYPKDQEDLRKKFDDADGFVIVSPEYNSGYPGELKILLDTFLDEYEGKPVAIVGVSAGIFGGIRMIEKLKPVLLNIGMIPIRTTVNFKNINQVFENGELQEEKYNRLIDDLIKDLKEKL